MQSNSTVCCISCLSCQGEPQPWSMLPDLDSFNPLDLLPMLNAFLSFRLPVFDNLLSADYLVFAEMLGSVLSHPGIQTPEAC